MIFLFILSVGACVDDKTLNGSDTLREKEVPKGDGSNKFESKEVYPSVSRLLFIQKYRVQLVGTFLRFCVFFPLPFCTKKVYTFFLKKYNSCVLYLANLLYLKCTSWTGGASEVLLVMSLLTRRNLIFLRLKDVKSQMLYYS